MTSIGELRRRTLEALTRPSYSISNKDMLLLNDNANLFGVNPAVEEVARSYDFARLWAYPSENSDALRERIASEFGLSADEVIVGNGSDEILDIASKCFINPGDVFCSPTPTFSMYKFYARLHLARISEKMLREDFSLDPAQLIEDRSKLTALCQPNNPTAVLFDAQAVKKVLDESYGIVMLDEAYAEFCGSSMMNEVMAAEHAIDVRTFSKAYGLAGLRIGYAVSRKEVIDELRSVRTPFGLNSFAESVAIRAMDNQAWVRDVVSEVKSEMTYVRPKLEALGFEVYPSDCNFLLCKAPSPSPALVSALRAEGVAIRDCNSYPLLENHVRITMAPRPMLDALLEKLERLVRGGSG
ncbi:MAG: histidinol-phosphate transaminase [Candidatus Thermoplasmatota archaeon]|nr:histidinol-phosphate transaminase [Candidatus Thermoplasmatota archaeon]